MEADDYVGIVARCGSHADRLAQRERWRLMQGWREVFAAPYFAASGKWKRGQFDWHVFSFEDTRALKGARALEAYRGELAARLLVVPETEAWPAFQLEGARVPDFSAVSADVYIWPPDLSWTMVFTHEQDAGFGPYFSRREWAAQ